MPQAVAAPLIRGLSRACTTLSAAVLLTAGTCYGCPPESTPPAPSLALMHPFPAEVWTTPGQQFTVRVLVNNANGYELPEEDLADLQWTSSLTAIPPTSGSSSKKLQAPSVGPFPLNFTVTASFSGYAPVTIQVHVVDATVPGTGDWVAAQHNADDPPAIALVDGESGGVTVQDALVAFVGAGSLGYFRCPGATSCGELTFFSRIQPIHRESAIGFTDGCEAFDFAGGVAFPGCTTRTLSPIARKVPVNAGRVFILSSDASLAAAALSTMHPSLYPPTIDPAGIVARDIAYTQKVLADGRTGLVFDPVAHRVPTAETDITFGPSMSCTGGMPSVRDQLQTAGVPTPPPDQITIVYVGKLLQHDGNVAAGYNGVTCLGQAGESTIILINWSEWNGTVLAHELMHALGPWMDAPWGHTNSVDGFNENNVLWEGESGYIRVPRSQITLGQAFRLSMDSWSIFHRTAEPFPKPGTFLCQGIWSTDEHPCPRLGKDVKP